ncbi:MAG: MgtC/SapB family protein [Bacteroidaceae bacterium]|nr:MgtC/SapB family protein [Bacteroidaceae bacterium]
MTSTTTFLLRILVAALLGGAIGMERGFRAKEAGFRTHFLVALGAALFMILSAHGFGDVVLSDSHRLDVSRIAAQVVSGIGFIGAGTIIFQRHAVHGLTTAAGLWVTAAIGMAAGAGLFIIAAFTTALVLLGLEVLNGLLPSVGHRTVSVSVPNDDGASLHALLDHLHAEGLKVITYNTSQETPHRLNIRMELRSTRPVSTDQLLQRLSALDGLNVESVE